MPKIINKMDGMVDFSFLDHDGRTISKQIEPKSFVVLTTQQYVDAMNDEPCQIQGLIDKDMIYTTDTAGIILNLQEVSQAVTFEALNINGDVGTGATQVAQGNHSHAGAHTHANMTTLDGVQEALTTVLKTAYDGAVTNSHVQNTDLYLATQITRTLYVDVNRTDTYTEDGSFTRPFKTINAAINQIATNNDDAVNPYTIRVKTGKYYETVTVESLNIHRLKFVADGVVQIRPTTNQSFKSIANNANLNQLHFDGFSFLAPIDITGGNGSTAFGDVIWDNCNLVAGDGTQVADLNLTCINNFSIRNAYIDINNITYNNVNYSIFSDCNIGANFAITMDSDVNLPSQGYAGGVILNWCSLPGTPSFTIAGTNKNYQFQTTCSRVGGAASAVTIPTGLTVTAYNSFYRGTWTNNGSLVLRNSEVATLAGTAPTYGVSLGGATRPLHPRLYSSWFDTALATPRIIWCTVNTGVDVWVDATGTAV